MSLVNAIVNAHRIIVAADTFADILSVDHSGLGGTVGSRNISKLLTIPHMPACIACRGYTLMPSMAARRSVRAIALALGRAASTISRELRRNALEGGAYRPQLADGSYLLRRQRPALLECDRALAAYATDRLIEG